MRPRFNTKVQVSVNLTELRASLAGTPVYDFKLSYDVMRNGVFNGVTYDELKSLMGFYESCRGSWDSFLYEHPDDHAVTGQEFGTGDGSTTDFMLKRSWGGFTERVANANVVSQITVANTPTSNYTLSSQGVVTFTAAPAANASLAWTGTYYYRCRFTSDAVDFNQLMHNLWNARTVEFVGNLGTKI